MPVHFKTLDHEIPNGTTGAKELQLVADFTDSNGRVVRADCALKSFNLDFKGHEVDHKINVVQVVSGVSNQNFSDGKVHVRLAYGFADKNFDDPYTGRIRVLVIAEVE